MAAYNKKFIVSANSFQPPKTLTLSQTPSLRKELMKKNQMARWRLGSLKFVLNFTVTLAHLYCELLNNGCH